jgi:hypothetical protein
MSSPRRYLLASLVTGILIIICYFFYAWSVPDLPSGRTLPGRLLGLLGLSTILGALFSAVQQHRQVGGKEVWYPWHLMLGILSAGLIFAHASLRFGNLLATLGAVFLLGVVLSGVIVAVLDGKITRLSQQTPPFTASPEELRYPLLRQRSLTLHLALTVGLMTFVLIHIISVLYY